MKKIIDDFESPHFRGPFSPHPRQDTLTDQNLSQPLPDAALGLHGSLKLRFAYLAVMDEDLAEVFAGVVCAGPNNYSVFEIYSLSDL